MIQPGEIHSIAGSAGVRDTQIEKDYVISWVTYGIANNSFLKHNILFKGGTALKKVYFQDYRFSEDLDFTFIGNHFSVDNIISAFEEMINWVFEESRITLSVADITQHKTGNFNFYLTYTGPLGGVSGKKDIKVDISKDEIICDVPEERNVINLYSDLKQENYVILCYSLDEIIGEKMRSIMQRTAPRDIYDLWYIFQIEGLNIEDYCFIFEEKARYKGINHKELSEVAERKKKIFEKQWREHLIDQISNLPDFDDVWRDLKKHWRRFQKIVK